MEKTDGRLEVSPCTIQSIISGNCFYITATSDVQIEPGREYDLVCEGKEDEPVRITIDGNLGHFRSIEELAQIMPVPILSQLMPGKTPQEIIEHYHTLRPGYNARMEIKGLNLYRINYIPPLTSFETHLMIHRLENEGAIHYPEEDVECTFRTSRIAERRAKTERVAKEEYRRDRRSRKSLE